MEKKGLLHEEITKKIIGAAMEVHRVLGPGFLEAVYEEALCIEFKKRGMQHENQKELKIPYKGVILQHTYRADLIVEDKVIIDAKATSGLTEIDEAQLFNYLKVAEKDVGLLINFGRRSLEWKRFITKSYFQTVN